MFNSHEKVAAKWFLEFFESEEMKKFLVDVKLTTEQYQQFSEFILNAYEAGRMSFDFQAKENINNLDHLIKNGAYSHKKKKK